ncbi:MAG: Ig-like domain-containing protein [Methanocellales archaeon]|nr:Ig-like domain-containing protein [Methanocellales archaeon]
MVLSVFAVLVPVHAATSVTITSPTTAAPAYVQSGGTVDVTYNFDTDAVYTTTGTTYEDVTIEIYKGLTLVGSRRVSHTVAVNATHTFTITVTLSPVAPDGSYDVRVLVEDRDGSSSSFDIETNAVIVDSTEPNVLANALTAPNGGEYWAGGSTRTIIWTATDITDANLGTAPITLEYSTDSGVTYPNLIATNLANTGSYTWTVPSIDSSTVRVRITATDLAGNSASDESNADFTIDSTLPVITIDTVTTPTNEAIQNITGTYIEDNLATIDVNGVPATVDEVAGTYSATVSLSEGSNTITATATDQVGHTATATDTIVLDTAAPTISALTPAPSSYVDTATPTISAALADDNSGIDTATVVIKVDDIDVTADATVTETSVSYTPTADLSQGNHTVTVAVSDNAGNTATASWSFTVDTIYPKITIDEVTTPTNTPSQIITGTYIEDNLATIDVNGVPATVDEVAGTYSATVSLSEGSNTITATATDQVGHTATATVTIVLDTAAPTISALTPAPSSYVDTATPTISAALADDNSGIDTATVVIKVDDIDVTADATVTETSVSYTPTADLSQGNHTVTVAVSDNAGNTATATWSFIIDTTPPTITPIYPVDGKTVYEVPTIEVLLSDMESGINPETIIPKIDGDEPGWGGGEWIDEPYVLRIYFGKDIAEGEHTATVIVSDNAGNSNQTTWSFTVMSEYEIELYGGWNLISLPLIPENSSIEAVLSGMEGGTVESVWAYDASTGDWYVYTPGPAADTLTEMKDGIGYWVKMDGSADLVVRGVTMYPGAQVPPSYPVYEGWNLIGFKSTEWNYAEDYLASVWDYFNEPWSYPLVYYPESKYGFYSAYYMEPGHGYWIYMSEDGMIAPPAPWD